MNLRTTKKQRDDIIAASCLRDMVSRHDQTRLAQDCNELEAEVNKLTKELAAARGRVEADSDIIETAARALLQVKKLREEAQHTAPVAAVLVEVDRAMTKYPGWPTDPLHALAVLGEEYGELTKAVLQQVYEPSKNPADAVRTEAVQAAAMALRFLASLDTYEYHPSKQHAQDGA